MINLCGELLKLFVLSLSLVFSPLKFHSSLCFSLTPRYGRMISLYNCWIRGWSAILLPFKFNWSLFSCIIDIKTSNHQKKINHAEGYKSKYSSVDMWTSVVTWTFNLTPFTSLPWFSLTLKASISTYKFSTLTIIHFLEELIERICLKIKGFSSRLSFTISHKLFFWWCKKGLNRT